MADNRRTILPDVPQERIVLSFHCGVFPNNGGGIVLKLLFVDHHTESIALTAQLFPFLSESLQRSIDERKYADLRLRKSELGDLQAGRFHNPVAIFLENQPRIAQADFDAIDDRRTVKACTWHSATNGVVLELTFADDHEEVFGLHAQLCFYLKDYLSDAIATIAAGGPPQKTAPNIDFRKAVADFMACRNILRSNINLFHSGCSDAYRVVAVELRKLLCDGKSSLLPRLFPSGRLHPLTIYRPGENLEGLVFQMPGILSGDGTGKGRLHGLFAKHREPIALEEWLNQPLFSAAITIRELIRSVADKEAAHSDNQYNPTLQMAKGVILVDQESHVKTIVAIGEYILELLDFAEQQLPQQYKPSGLSGAGAT